jgi:mannose-6-phosphate isomerase-like protein (cupin superfamily)
MRTALLLSFVLVAPGHTAADASAAPPQAAPRTSTQKPAAPARTQTAAGRGGLALLVTTPTGRTLSNVQVDLDGPTPRSGTTNASGQLNFTGLQAGTYRLRFTGEEVTAFEKEVALRAGQTATIDIALNPAPPPREIVKEAPAPAAPAPGPAGSPQTLSLVDLAERELDRRQPRRETLVACSGSTRATLVQLNQDQPARLYEDAESMLYVIAGEGTLTVGDRETRLEAGSFASVPRNTGYSIGRRGRNPLILLSVLGGPACEEAR